MLAIQEFMNTTTILCLGEGHIFTQAIIITEVVAIIPNRVWVKGI